MTALSLALILLSQVSLVTGQIFMKRGMTLMNAVPRPTRRVAGFVAAGIGGMTGWFLIWLGLLQRLDLSFLYPFQGISPVLMVLASMLFLRERPTWSLAFGVALIVSGTLLVGLSEK